MAGPYVRQIRNLRGMQSFHRFFLQSGVAVSSAVLFVAVIVAMTLSKYGWERTANLLFGTVLVGCVLGPLCFFINLFVLRAWRCPRCGIQTVGWVEKEPKCFDCGLDFGKH
jgi:hypothetical protein